MKFLVVGLGNPGSEYNKTRHNIGFEVVDYMAAEAGEKFKSDRLAEVCTIKHKGRIVVMIKPNTYMNLSGKAVQYWMQAEKIPVENILVLVDDLALPFGAIRIRPGGSDAGHNGLKNINEVLKTQNYARLRFGIGNNYPKGHQADFVLSPFNKEEITALNDRIKLAADAVKSFASIGLAHTMNLYNNK